MPSIEQVLGQLRTQPDSDLSMVSIAKLKKQITSVWKAHETAIVAATAQMTSITTPDEPGRNLPFQEPCDERDTGGPPSLDCALAVVDTMETGDEGVTAGELYDSRRQAAVWVVVGFLLIYRTTDDATLKEGLLPLIDMAYDYAVLLGGPRQNIDSNVEALLTWFL